MCSGVQITQFGMTSGGHLGDRAADHIGGLAYDISPSFRHLASACPCRGLGVIMYPMTDFLTGYVVPAGAERYGIRVVPG
jgi:hypothetical protein